MSEDTSYKESRVVITIPNETIRTRAYIEGFQAALHFVGRIIVEVQTTNEVEDKKE
jgi:hypothetical protein